MHPRATALLVSLCLAPIASAQLSEPQSIPQPNVIYSFMIDGDRVIVAPSAILPPGAFTESAPFPPTPEPATPVRLPPEEKISEDLALLLAAGSFDDTVDVIVGFKEDLVIPRFPDLVPDQPLDSSQNIAARNQADDLIKALHEARSPRYEEFIGTFGARVSVLGRFWITPSLLVRTEIAQISLIAEDEDVTSLELETSSIPPPSCCQVDDGRAYIGSLSLGDAWGGGSVALLDTGVRATHTQLVGRIGLMRDCVAGTAAGCLGGNQQPGDICSHGTSSAAIIAANANQGPAYRGVTVGTIDSFKVYDPPSKASFCTLNRAAVQRAFQAALANLNKIIVAEMQDNTGWTGMTTVAAENAFSAGAVVIAATGNSNNVTAPGGPGNGHKVIAVGDRSLPSDVTFWQVSGPTSDGRIKPDLQAPTDTETASSTSNTALQYFSGTSGATPYAAGAAVILRNMMLGELSVSSVDPGMVYSLLLQRGRQSLINDQFGAGPIDVMRDRTISIEAGTVHLSHGQQVDVPFSVCGYGLSHVGGAIWWPESAAGLHRRVQLSLIDPSGIVRATSSHPTSVFQKVDVAAGIVFGSWKLRIQALSVPNGTQQIYWTSGYNGELVCTIE